MTRDQLPSSLAYGPISFVLPEDRVMRRPLTAFEDGAEALPLERNDPLAGERLGITHVGNIETGGHQVDQMARFLCERVRFADNSRPACDERSGYPSLMYPVLVKPERGVRNVRPRDAVALVCFFGTRHQTRNVA